VQAPPASAAASGRWGAPVAGLIWPTVEGRATHCQRPQSKQVPPWRPGRIGDALIVLLKHVELVGTLSPDGKPLFVI
jgi:hypothetical protein